MTDHDSEAPEHQRSLAAGRRRRIRQQRSATAVVPSYVELPATAAAPRMGLSAEALWQRLRRAGVNADGFVELGGGLLGFRRGRRSWFVRFPLG